MPGRSAGAPTGDADADSDCRGPRSGSAQRRTVTGVRRIRTTCRAARRAHLLVTPTRTRTAGVLAVARPSAALWLGSPRLGLVRGPLGYTCQPGPGPRSAVTGPGRLGDGCQLRQLGVAGRGQLAPWSWGRGALRVSRLTASRQAHGPSVRPDWLPFCTAPCDTGFGWTGWWGREPCGQAVLGRC